MLRKLSAHNPAEWDKYLGAVLLAYRQQPHSSTGFSPFFLLFGRAPRGPMTMLKDFMLYNDPSCVKSLTFYYVQDLHKRMKEACEIAQQNIGNVASAAQDRTNPKSRLKVFAPGDDILVLLPDHANKLALSLKGPFKIVKRITRVVYSVDINGKPILIIPDVQDDFIVRTDASDYGIGAALMQMRDGVLRPCKYASRKLKPCETRYSTIERECLAIIFAVGQFYKYLAMRPFVLETDHRPLLFLKSGQAKNSRLLRWCLALQEFSFTIKAIPGSLNYHADVLSRLC
ncbi:reverse transcriptase [Plakobranchus ocellatus]|uniref:Reverse transcriptase n=1 Tax=Plakobranchus ocellatus TaxID=259542 RepID=A0AAV4D068_9GAST|nr:reverse transcriptase [Plakobranchus ocellatus]